MLDVSNLLFMSDKADKETAKKDFGMNAILGDNYIITSFNEDYFMIINGHLFYSYNKNNYINTYKGSTQIWLTKKFADLNVADENSYYIFTDNDLKKFDGILKIEKANNNIGGPRISIIFKATDYSDIDKFHDVVCGIFGVNQFSTKRSIMYDLNYDPNKDGCFCRVCNKWNYMASPDGLPDGKINCWVCSTYRLHSCRKAIASL